MNKRYIRCEYGEIPKWDLEKNVKSKSNNLPEGLQYTGQYILVGESWYPLVRSEKTGKEFFEG